jgi:site-specific DNA-cytosine methylase
LGEDEDGLPNVKKARMSHIYKRLDSTKPAYTVTGSGGGGTHVYHFKEPRALTNRERARLQTFEDSYKFEGGKESVRRQIGMAVPVLAAKKVMLEVRNALVKKRKLPNIGLGRLIHDWMIKAHGSELFFTGKETVETKQLELDI